MVGTEAQGGGGREDWVQGLKSAGVAGEACLRGEHSTECPEMELCRDPCNGI